MLVFFPGIIPHSACPGDSHEKSSSLHADRVVGGDCHHRHPYWFAFACRTKGTRGCCQNAVPEQHPSTRPGTAQLSRYEQSVPPRLASTVGATRRRRLSHGVSRHVWTELGRVALAIY